MVIFQTSLFISYPHPYKCGYGVHTGRAKPSNSPRLGGALVCPHCPGLILAVSMETLETVSMAKFGPLLLC